MKRQSICKRCAFTGYRPSKMPWGYDETDARCAEFRFRLRESLEYLIGKGYVDFLSGGALGFDQMAARIVLSLREKYPWVRLIMVIPFDGQADRWEPEYQARHARLFEEADMVTAISHQYTRSCLFIRNRYLVNNADLLLAAYDGQAGGTAMTVEYGPRWADCRRKWHCRLWPASAPAAAPSSRPLPCC